MRDVAEVRGAPLIDAEIAAIALEMLDVDELGLDEIDRRILHTIIDKFEGGPVGIDTIAAATRRKPIRSWMSMSPTSSSSASVKDSSRSARNTESV